MIGKDKLFRVSGAFLVALILVSIFSGVPLGFIGGNVAKAQTVVSLTTSRDAWNNVYNNMNFSVTVRLSQLAGDNITLTVTVGGQVFAVNATRVPGTFDYRSIFNVLSDGTLYSATDGRTLTQLSDGDVITFEYGGVSKSLTYQHSALDVSMRTSVPYKVNETSTSDWTFMAPDLNKAFNLVDKAVFHGIFVDVTHDRKSDLYILAEETDANSGEFKAVVVDSADFGLPVVNTTSNVNPGDTVVNESIVTFKSGVKAFNGKEFDVSLGIKVTITNANATHFNVSVDQVNITITGKVFDVTNLVMGNGNDVPLNSTASFTASSLGFDLEFSVNYTDKQELIINVTSFNVDLRRGAYWFMLYDFGEVIDPAHVARVVFHAAPYQDAVVAVADADEVVRGISVFRAVGSFVSASATIATLSVTLTDANANKDILVKETVDVTLTLPNGTSRTVTLVETGKDTGEFAASVSILADFTFGFNRTHRTLELTYNDVDEGVTVTTSVDVTFNTAEVSVSPEEIVFGGGVLTITVTDNDLNVDPGTAEIRRFGLGSGDELVLMVNVSDTDTRMLGRLMVLAVNATHEMPLKVKSGRSVVLLMLETGSDTGMFVMNVSMRDFDIPTDNTEKFKIVFEDHYTADQKIRNVTVEVVGRPVTLTVDRDVVPASLKGVKIKISVEDPSQNVDEFSRESVSVSIALYNITGDQVASTTVSLTETGIDTGKFAGEFTVPTDSSWFGDPRKTVGGKIVISYSSPAGSDKEVLDVVVYDATLSVSTSQVMFGDEIEVMVEDPDSNVDTGEKDTVMVNVRYVEDGVEKTATITLVETEENSGVFKATLVVAKDGDIFSDPGTQIRFSYTDDTASVTSHADASWTSQTLTQSVAVLSFVGEIQAPEAGAEFQPFARFTVTIKDEDANVNVDAKDTVQFSIRLPDGTIKTLTATETDVSSGVFERVVSIPDDITATPQDLVGQTIQIIYQDRFTPAGVQNIIVHVSVVAFDGEVSLDKESYNVGDVVTITVRDPDANRDPDRIDTVRVKVTSTSDPVGPPEIVLRETGEDTGEFVGLIVISDNPADLGVTGKIFANVGDTITVTYTDTLPADYPAVKSISVSATARVGVFVEKPVETEEVKPVDPQTGQEVTPKVGETVFIQVRVRNTDPVERTFIVIVQILDPDGVPVSVQFQQVTLAPGEERVLGFGFTPQAAGDYTVQVFIFRSLDDQTPLGEKTEQSVTVEE